MSVYAVPIKVGIIVFPIIALLITIPYMIKQYHKYGAIPPLRTFIIYSFVLYLLIAWFMVILPLPKIEEVSKMTGPWAQLIPFTGLKEIINTTSFNILNPSTYIATLKNSSVYTVLFNFLLTLPFGVYLRYYFKRRWWEVLAMTFVLSFFFEVTQFSGLFGIYPRPYRLFDVDDLIVNTTGGLLGYIITPLFSKILPSRNSLDEEAYRRGETVSFPRRAIATLIDFVIISIVCFLTILQNYLDIFILMYAFLLYCILSTLIFNGRTIGKMVVGIRVVSNDGNRAKLHQILIRYTIKFFLYFEIFYVTIELSSLEKLGAFGNILIIVLYVLLAIVFLRSIINTFNKKKPLVYESLSKTKHISTIKHKIIEKQSNTKKEEPKKEKDNKIEKEPTKQ